MRASSTLACNHKFQPDSKFNETYLVCSTVHPNHRKQRFSVQQLRIMFLFCNELCDGGEACQS